MACTLMNADSDIPHVLVVDDNFDATEVLALLIEAEGFSTATARTLAQACECVANAPPRLIFLDVNLPDGSGMNLLAEVKNDLRTAGIHVVMLSGLMDPRISEEAHLLGASAFVTKPMDHKGLTALLNTVR